MILKYFLLGFGGALAFEILNLYEKMGKLESGKFKALLTSQIYWIMTLLMASASGFIAWGINSGVDTATVWQILTSGVAARTLVSKPMELKVAHSNVELGRSKKISIRDIFG